ncbi:MAG: MATE family efflux transporter [bacterium]|nr:MATE family efflux transporter [bacterium]
MRNIWKDKVFLSTMITLAIPITLQNFITSSLNLVDNLMIGKLGETPIAAVGLANQFFYIFLLCIAGVNAGANVFMAQYWGKKDIENIKKMLGIVLSVGFAATIVFGIAGICFPTQIMGLFSKDAEVISQGATYMRIVSVSAIFINITQGFSTALRSTEQPKLPMFGSLIGVAINAFLNWIFIFGNLGAPAMGVAGAAIATTIARVIEMVFIVSMVYVRRNLVSTKIKQMFSYTREDVARYFSVSTSAILNELVWSFGLMAFSMAYALIGTNAVATMQIATTLNNMFLVICIGLAVSASIMIGNKIGSDEEEVARDYANKIGILAPLCGFILGIIIWITAPFITSLFDVQPETAIATTNVLRIMAVVSALRFFNVVMIIGVYRGGGDTLYTTILQSCTVWVFAVPLAFICAAVFKLSVEQVFLAVCAEEVVKIFFVLQRLKSGKWIRNVIKQTA